MRVVIVGAAGRDFHDFNVAFRGRTDVEVVAFTQAPGQNLGAVDDDSRRYPAELAGEGYPDGIPIVPESDLERVVRERDVDQVIFSYSDVSHEHVMHVASRALAAGADFRLLGPDAMMLPLDVPVVAVDAVRTGCGKSRLTGMVADALADAGLTVRVVREPMPYGNLAANRVQRFASDADLAAADLTVEEREEYERHVDAGRVVFAGVDYADVLRAAEAEAEAVVWDGGNNELPFAAPDLHFVLADPLRAGDEVRYHPGETNLRLADYVVVTKENSADEGAVETVVSNARETNPDATVVHADSVVSVDDPDRVAGARVLVVEDGPSVTHGNAPAGAGAVAARKFDAAERVDPTPHAVGTIADALDEHPHLDRTLPALGYSDEQLEDLAATIRNCTGACDLVLAATPVDLGRLVDVDVPVVDVTYDLRLHDTSVESILTAEFDAVGG